MTAPNRRPSVEGALGNHEKRISTLESIAPPTATAASEEGWGSCFNLPVLERNMETNNQNYSGAVSYVIDSTYPHNGYISQSSNNNWIEWIVQLGPRGSLWLPIVQFAKGPDFGKVTLQIASTPYIADLLSVVGSGGIESSGLPVTFVDVQTFDAYAAVHDPYPTSPQVYNAFEITGTDGTTGTSITGTNPWNWDGGSGAHFIRLKTDGKNSSSSGYKKRISSFIMQRVSNDMYA